MRKGPARVFAIQGGIVGEARIVERAFGVCEVTMSRTSASTVKVDCATSDGTAQAGSDYTDTSRTLAFAAGETSMTVSVPVIDDSHDEASETFTLALSNASGGNAYLNDATATGTIENSDPMPIPSKKPSGEDLGSQ